MIPESFRTTLAGGESASAEMLPDATNTTRIARTVCAFLNGDGGTLFCGVNSGGKVIGIDRAEEQAAELREFLQNAITPHGALLSITVDEEAGRKVITIEVPAGEDKPYLYEGAAYVRQNQRVEPVTAEGLRQMVQASSTALVRWERRLSPALADEDLDTREIQRTVEEATRAGRFAFANRPDTWSVLSDLGLVQRQQLTNAADVLFAVNPALRHPQVRVRATAFAEDKDSDEYLDDKIYEGPLVEMLKQLETFVQRNTRTSISFGQGLQTSDRPDYPQEAVREGLVNAFAHRDYESFSGGVVVQLYPGRLEIQNSGTLPDGLKPSDLKRHHPSIPVNPDIVHVLYIRSLMNRIGRGTQKIVNACLAAGLREPVWQADDRRVLLTLFSARKRGAAARGSLNERQLALLKVLKAGDELSPAEYRERFAIEVSVRQARRDLVELADANLLERLGAGAGTRYRRTTRTG